MFDIGFSELLLIAVVALVVIGPERLPGVARNVGRFAGRMQRYVNDIKRDFNREVEFEEIRRLQQEMETTVQSMQESMRVVETTLKHEVDRQQTLMADAVSEPVVPPASTPTLAAEDVPALTKPRIRKKREPKTAEPAQAAPAAAAVATPVTPPASSAAAGDDQYRLF